MLHRVCHATSQNQQIDNRKFATYCSSLSLLSAIGTHEWTLFIEEFSQLQGGLRFIVCQREMSLSCMFIVVVGSHYFWFFIFKLPGAQIIRLNKTVCPSGLRGWTQVPLARAAWVQIPQLSFTGKAINLSFLFVQSTDSICHYSLLE